MKSITTAQLQEQLENNQTFQLLDVREDEEIKEGHIPNITHIPLGLLEAKMHELNKQTPYIVICRSGGRSGKAAQLLESYGYDVTNMTGGMLDWNGPITRP